ncbi:hypothetical protein FALCPG4_013286 [Fusarium falciforme]
MSALEMSMASSSRGAQARRVRPPVPGSGPEVPVSIHRSLESTTASFSPSPPAAATAPKTQGSNLDTNLLLATANRIHRILTSTISIRHPSPANSSLVALPTYLPSSDISSPIPTTTSSSPLPLPPRSFTSHRSRAHPPANRSFITREPLHTTLA